ncbi:hypothetical protein [Brevibacterium litoralis]|uniref:hypothetical protein n=1 Tax=Brevibacterium litoralis TaxID=3138935 RepID=UPI0032EF12FB
MDISEERPPSTASADPAGSGVEPTEPVEPEDGTGNIARREATRALRFAIIGATGTYLTVVIAFAVYGGWGFIALITGGILFLVPAGLFSVGSLVVALPHRSRPRARTAITIGVIGLLPHVVLLCLVALFVVAPSMDAAADRQAQKFHAQEVAVDMVGRTLVAGEDRKIATVVDQGFSSSEADGLRGLLVLAGAPDEGVYVDLWVEITLFDDGGRTLVEDSTMLTLVPGQRTAAEYYFTDAPGLDPATIAQAELSVRDGASIGPTFEASVFDSVSVTDLQTSTSTGGTDPHADFSGVVTNDAPVEFEYVWVTGFIRDAKGNLIGQKSVAANAHPFPSGGTASFSGNIDRYTYPSSSTIDEVFVTPDGPAARELTQPGEPAPVDVDAEDFVNGLAVLDAPADLTITRSNLETSSDSLLIIENSSTDTYYPLIYLDIELQDERGTRLDFWSRAIAPRPGSNYLTVPRASDGHGDTRVIVGFGQIDPVLPTADLPEAEVGTLDLSVDEDEHVVLTGPVTFPGADEHPGATVYVVGRDEDGTIVTFDYDLLLLPDQNDFTVDMGPVAEENLDYEVLVHASDDYWTST